MQTHSLSTATFEELQALSRAFQESCNLKESAADLLQTDTADKCLTFDCFDLSSLTPIDTSSKATVKGHYGAAATLAILCCR